MNFKRCGFTMAELLVVLVVAGFLLIFELMTLKNRTNQYSATYYTVYNALKKASYQILADPYCPGDNCPVSGLTAPRAYPTETEDLCERLIEYINVASNTLDNGQAVCTGAAINKLASNFNDSDKKKYTLQFVGSSGLKFYISDYNNGGNAIQTTGDTKEVNYFIVYVDLNGDKKPNRVDNSNDMKGIYPDIVPFALTTLGDAVPMGFPIFVRTYLTARVKLPLKIDDTTGNITDDRYSAAMTFYEAVHKSWGDDSYRDIPFSIDFTAELNASSKARDFYSYPTAPGIDSDEGCTAGTYTCRAVVDISDRSRY